MNYPRHNREDKQYAKKGNAYSGLLFLRAIAKMDNAHKPEFQRGLEVVDLFQGSF
jgi:hypothetical protein